MRKLSKNIRTIIKVLNKHKVEYIVVGGVGSILQGADIFTKDIDVCPENNKENFERLSAALKELGGRLRGAQNVEVSNISWLSGGISITPSLMLPYNRIAIIVFTIAVLLLLVYLLNKTRFGLFVRAVTQNRQMAQAVGIRSSRIDMMAFGLGSGLAGLAGCALAQVGNVGPDLGQNYIIDAFLVVVVGGVGQVWGAVLAALGLGISSTALEIGIGAVLAKIVLLVLVILFIQKRPQGLFAIKGRFVE